MKSYTDLEQSNKLAEILPIESADMCYRIVAYNPNDTHVYQPYCFCGTLESDIPCWSLAALLSVIPQELFDKEYIINITEGLKYKWIISYEPSFNVSSYIHVSNDNLIDCCVEIISKLKEKNLL